MMRDDDEESYVQIACDFDEVGGADDGCFDLEYRDGDGSPLFHCVKRVSANAVEGIFLDELTGQSSWRARYEWKQFGLPTGTCTKCFIYRGKHRVMGGKTHWCEHAPLHWSTTGEDRRSRSLNTASRH